ncbi:TlpA family protein disulfide reductase [Candidatus Dojkabacteria bacterium]|uniref:TlpA family protein disulfide reductase n=1 Tax=Candidatus Dojkabacteria bacterium TaxID=2099670 RepID=A0A955L6K4_9BACT|nr:TlpA family protein disulfide reductase [Candidatus Dojkabacteria bacterium]
MLNRKNRKKIKSIVYVLGLMMLPITVIGGLLFFFGNDSPKDLNYKVIENEALQNKYSGLKLETREGKNVRLTKYKGSILLVNSWAMWNPFCMDELASFSKLKEEFPEQITIVAVNRTESQEEQEAYIKQVEDRLEIDMSNIIFLNDFEDEFYQVAEGVSMPETLIFDKYGNLVVHKTGPMPLEDMQNLVKQYL